MKKITMQLGGMDGPEHCATVLNHALPVLVPRVYDYIINWGGSITVELFELNVNSLIYNGTE